MQRLDFQSKLSILKSGECLQELGTLSVRGYAYQEAYPLLGVNLFPNVRTVRHLPASFNEIIQNAQVSPFTDCKLLQESPDLGSNC